MPVRKTPLVEGEYYHIYNRGNNRSEIFFDDEDRDRFVKLLYLCNSNKAVNFRDYIVERKIDTWAFDRGQQLVSIGAWVLMPNHFHVYLIINPKARLLGEKQKAVTVFMSKLGTAYSKYINLKYGRTGRLFENNFKSEHVSGDNHAKYLFSYIHLNPIKLMQSMWKEEGIEDISKAKEFLGNYWWSSYFDHCGSFRKENAILSLSDFPKYFRDKKSVKNEIFEWLSFHPKAGLLGKG